MEWQKQIGYDKEGNEIIFIVYSNGKYLELSKNASLMYREMEKNEIGKKFKELLSHFGDVIEKINLSNFMGFYVSRGIDNSDPNSPHKSGRAIDISIAYFIDNEKKLMVTCKTYYNFWFMFADLLSQEFDKPFNQIICPFGILDITRNKQVIIDNLMNNNKLIADKDLEVMKDLISEHQNHFHINLMK